MPPRGALFPFFTLLTVYGQQFQSFPTAFQACNPQQDTLLLPDSDPKSQGDTFLQCRGNAGPQSTQGVWQILHCPQGLKFFFEQQQCLYIPPVRGGGFPVQGSGSAEIAFGQDRPGSTAQTRTTLGQGTGFGGQRQGGNPLGFGGQTPFGGFGPPNNPNSINQVQSQVYPGESCRSGETCMGGSFCSRDIQVCICPDGKSESGGRCVDSAQKSKPGDQCSANWQCAGDSVCQNGLCACPPPTVDVGGECVLRVTKTVSQIGEDCLNGQECASGTVCSPINGLCVCPAGTVHVIDECVPAEESTQPPQHRVLSSGPGESCRTGERCTGDSVCQGGTCRCLGGYVTEGNHCVKQKQVFPGSPCTNNDICTGGSRCDNGWCLCPPGTIPEGPICARQQAATTLAPTTSFRSPHSGPSIWPVNPSSSSNPILQPVVIGNPKGIDEACVTNMECPLGAYCKRRGAAHSCQCLSTHVAVGKQCHRIVYPGQTGCAHNEQCAASYDGAFCTSGTCQCPHGHKVAKQTCVVGGGGGIGGVPAQQNPYPAVSPQAATPRQARPGQECPNPETVCVGGSQCVRGWCVCKEDEVVSDGRCAAKLQPTQRARDLHIRLGEPCNVLSLCEGDGVCSLGVCACPPGTANNEGQCQRLAQPAQQTEQPVIQSVGSFVQPTEPHVPMSQPGGRCDRGQICVANAVCDSGVCVCPAGWALVSGECQKTRQAPPESPCDRLTVCMGGSVCTGGRCTCQRGMVLNEERQCAPPAAKRRKAGEMCRIGDTCLGGSACSSGYCVCPQGFVNLNGNCISQAALAALNPRPGLPIPVAPEIPARTSGEVQPRPGPEVHRPEEQPNTPVKRRYTDAAVPGEACSPPLVVCSGNSRCYRGYCVCPQGTISYNKMCVPEYGSTDFGFGTDDISLGLVGSSLGTVGNTGTLGYSTGIQVPRGTDVEHVIGTGPGGFTTGIQQPQGSEFEHIVAQPMASQPRSAEDGGWRLVPPGRDCRSIDFCTDGSVCVGSTCLCSPGYMIFNERCLLAPTRPPATPPPVPTPPPQVLSLGGLQVGPFGAVPRGGVVKATIIEKPVLSIDNAEGRDRLPGDRCVRGVDRCVYNSACFSGRCRCVTPFVLQQRRCILRESSGKLTFVTPPTTPPNIGATSLRPTVPAVFPKAPQPTAASTMWTSRPSRPTATPRPPPLPPVSSPQGFPYPVEPKTVPPGMRCISGLDSCTGGSLCSMGECRCPADHRPVNGQCISDDEFVAAGQGTTTTEFSARQFGAERISCSHDAHCSGGSFCNAGECKCMPGHALKNGLCSKDAMTTALPGYPCSRGQFCTGNSFCSEREICECPEGTHLRGEMCRKILPKSTRIIPNAEKFDAAFPPCNESACALPECYCSSSGMNIPGGLAPEETPQLVILTFDDSVNAKTISIYKRLFDGRFKNPNGCPVKASFFVSHEWTNYDDTQWLSHQGHEIASNSITHSNLGKKSVQAWADEMDGMRRVMAKFANIHPSEVVGMRAPQLGIGEDAMFEMMQAYGFVYDNSMTTNAGEASPPYWPQTLDFKPAWDCHWGCPKKSHAGVWEVPINQFYGSFMEELNGAKRGSMISAAMGEEETEESILQLLRKNFDRAYKNNRAPYTLTLNAGFLNAIEAGQALTALERFLEDIQKIPDVWVVTMRQLIQWMQQPIKSQDMSTARPFQCTHSGTQTPAPCQSGNKCLYKTPALNSHEHLFRTCESCPKQYPWLENPEGD